MSGNNRPLPIIPLRSTIIFPGCVETIQISLPRNLLLLGDLRESNQQIVMVPVRDGRGEIGAADDLESVGVLARPAHAEQGVITAGEQQDHQDSAHRTSR